MVARVTWPQVLAWRMRRQLLDPVGTITVPGVVRRLCGVQTQIASSAELAIRLRREASRPGEVARALSRGTIVKTWAMRGALHLLSPEEAGAYLSLLASGRAWERPAWERYFGTSPSVTARLRDAVRDVLDGTILTREELVAEVTRRRGLRHLRGPLGSSWGMLFKPLAWQGDLCLGPSRAGRTTFLRPDQASTRWVPPQDALSGARIAIVAYLSAYGPATPAAFADWLSGGWLVGKRPVREWFGALGERLVELDVEGTRALLLVEDVDELLATRPSKVVRLLPGFDQYVLGPGTADGHAILAARRSAVSRKAGWIAPVVVAGGVVRGTWERGGDRVRVSWFPEGGAPPRRALEREVARLADVVGRELRLEIAALAPG